MKPASPFLVIAWALCVWVLLEPATPSNAGGMWALWLNLWNRNTWLVAAAFDSEKDCRTLEDRRVSHGMELLRSDKKDVWVTANVFVRSRCVPAEILDKIGVSMRASEAYLLR